MSAAHIPPKPLECLLQAILCPDERGATGFEEWCARTDFDDLPPSHFRLLGELHGVQDRLPQSWEHRARIAGVEKYVWTNNIHILNSTLPVVDALIQRGTSFALLKGCGTIAAHPEAVRRRFTRDMDVLVPPTDVGDIAEMLLATGWRPVTGQLPGTIRAQPFDRPSGAKAHAPVRAEIDLHHRILHFGRHAPFDDAILERTVPGNLQGRHVLIACPVDRVLIALDRALRADADPTYFWVLDCVRLLRDPEFDWADFAREVQRRRIATHAQGTLGYLAEAFGLPAAAGQTLATLPCHGLRLRLQEAEIRAAGRQRHERTRADWLALTLAEADRCGIRVHRVPYPTDFRVTLRRGSPLPQAAPTAEPFTWRATPQPAGITQIEITPTPSHALPRDYDLWCAHRWIARLRLRTRGPAETHTWQAQVPLPQGASPTDLHLESTGV